MSVYDPDTLAEFIQSAKAKAAVNMADPKYPSNVYPVNLFVALGEDTPRQEVTTIPPAFLPDGVNLDTCETHGMKVTGKIGGEDVVSAIYEVYVPAKLGTFFIGTINQEVIFSVSPEMRAQMGEPLQSIYGASTYD